MKSFKEFMNEAKDNNTSLAKKAEKIVNKFVDKVIKEYDKATGDKVKTRPIVKLKSSKDIEDDELVLFAYEEGPFYDLFSGEAGTNFSHWEDLSKLLDKAGFYMEPDNSYSSTIYKN